MTTTNSTKKTPTVGFKLQPEFGLLTMTFADGLEYRLQLSALTPELTAMATLHGLKQKLGDAGAISRNPETGRSATLEEKKAAVLEVFERLTTGGEWNKAREGGEGGGSGGGLLLRALARLYPGKTTEELKEFLAGKTAAQQASLRAHPKIATIIDALRAEGARTVDTEELLGELEPAQRATN